MYKKSNKNQSIGIDAVEAVRFNRFNKNKKHSFITKVFTNYEIEYCFSNKDVAIHLAGIFAAKEAVSKALGVSKYPFIEIEIKHQKDGKPFAYRMKKKLPVSVSISHTSKLAVAIALS